MEADCCQNCLAAAAEHLFKTAARCRSFTACITNLICYNGALYLNFLIKNIFFFQEITSNKIIFFKKL
ncbi:hypothetical protein DOY81_015482, partial [Sarcophaga bullata]